MGKYGRYGYTMDLQSLRMLGRHRRRRPRRPRMGTRTGSPELKVYAQTGATEREPDRPPNGCHEGVAGNPTMENAGPGWAKTPGGCWA